MSGHAVKSPLARRLAGLLSAALMLLAHLLPATTLAASAAPGQQGLPDVTMRIAGKPELLFAFSKSTGCAAKGVSDRPDMRPYAFRRDDGKVVLFASNSSNFAFVGDSLDSVRRDGCRRIFEAPPESADPADFHGRMWLKAAIEAPDGSILGFIHNEYHGELFSAEYCDRLHRGSQNTCWYGSSLIARSHDGGRSFVLPKSPRHVFATLPFRYAIGQGRIGYVSPYPLSHREGDTTDAMYVFFIATRPGSDKALRLTRSGSKGTCVMRGNGAIASQWRMWGGSDFDVQPVNPYASEVADADAHKCEPVLRFGLEAVKYLPAHKVYLAIGSDAGKLQYAVSRDLVNWSAPRVLMRTIGSDTWKAGDPAPTAYFSLLDPGSPTRSFETLEKRPYLYYVEYVGVARGTGDKSERRLMRMPLALEVQ
jgi:hypothetical protein